MAGASQTQDDIGFERRLAAFDLDGSLEADCREIWSLIEPEKAEIARQFWLEYARAPNIPFELDDAKIDALTQRIIPYVEAKYRNLGDPAWTEMAGKYVAAAAAAGIPLTTLYAGIAAAANLGQEVAGRKIEDSEQRMRLAKAFTRATLLEVDVYGAHFERLRAQ